MKEGAAALTMSGPRCGPGPPYREITVKIEHVAWNVENPVEVARWYVEHLGMTIVKGSAEGAAAHFIADDSGAVMLEMYNNPKVDTPDYPGMDPLLLHLAFVCDDVKGGVDRLVSAGAELVGDITVTDAGDELAMLRDPWGFAIQLARRAEPMI